MNRCRETAGILFKKKCPHPATQACPQCQKPICRAHVRMLGQAEVCISCARTTLQDPNQRGSYAYLRDDPYFYWFYYADYSDPYGADDYSLFDDDGSFGAGVDDHWEGT